MKHVLACIPYLLMAAICHAAEIVAWKVPLTSFAYQGLQSDGVVRCETAPEASPFFKPGDELWNLKGIALNHEHFDQRLDTDPPLEWVIWNASSGRLVTKCEWSGIWQLYGRLKTDQLPRLCRLTAEIFTVPADGSPLSNESTPVSTLSWICRFGQEFRASSADPDAMIEVDGSIYWDSHSNIANLDLHASFQITGKERMEFDTGANLLAGVPWLLARDFDGEKGMDFQITSRIELPDGTPSEEVILIQKAGTAEPFKVDRNSGKLQRVKDHGWLATQWFEPLELLEFMGETQPEADPFAGPPDLLREQLKLKDIQVPDLLEPWFKGKALDLRNVFMSNGVLVDPTSAFAGYDLATQQIFLYSEKTEELDRFEQLFARVGARPPINVAVTFDGKGQSRLISRSGRNANLTRSKDSENIIRTIEIEPTINDDGRFIDLRIHYEDNFDPTSVRSINTAAILLSTATPLELLSGKTSNAGENPPLRVKAEIQNAENH